MLFRDARRTATVVRGRLQAPVVCESAAEAARKARTRNGAYETHTSSRADDGGVRGLAPRLRWRRARFTPRALFPSRETARPRRRGRSVRTSPAHARRRSAA